MVTVSSLLEDPPVRAYLYRIIGEEGLQLLERFPDEGEFSDEDLAEKTDINLNAVRQALYTLYGRRLAEYRRIKNSETGWLTYLWTLRLDRISPRIEEDMEYVLDRLQARLRYEEENDFYICHSCGLIITFDLASDAGFVCPFCEEAMEHFDNEAVATALHRRVRKIEEALGGQ